MTNMDENGEISEHETARGVGWHADMCYMPLPAKATLLHTIEIPEEGGDTLFANMYMALAEMPQALRDKIDGLQATFRYMGRAVDRNLQLESRSRTSLCRRTPSSSDIARAGRNRFCPIQPIRSVSLAGTTTRRRTCSLSFTNGAIRNAFRRAMPGGLVTR